MIPRLTLAAPIAAAALAACTFGGGGIVPGGPAPVPARIAEADLDVPYVPTPRPVAAAMLDLAELQPGETLIDLGSGDGRIAIMAAQRGARALGVDIDPDRIREAVLAAQMAGVEGQARFRRQDLFATPIGEADVIAIYLLPQINLRLRPRLLTELRPGARIVSHAFAMGDWAPDAEREVDGARIFLWVVPATVGGRWAIEAPGEPPLILEVDQRFQQASGTLAGAEGTRALRDVALSGTRFAFTVDTPAGPRTWRMRVEGADLLPDGEGAWRGRRLP